MDHYDSWDFEFKGRQFRAFVHVDTGMGCPWEEHDGHGPVREGSRGYDGPEKRAGEWVLHDGGRNGYLWLYDYAEACNIARKDWGLNTENMTQLSRKLGRQPKKREIAAEAARLDFEHLRAWCNGDWFWCGASVQMLDGGGDPIGDKYAHALWGIESNDGDYLREVAEELASQIPSPRWEAAVTFGEGDPDEMGSFIDHDAAKRYLIGKIKHAERVAQTEADAEELCALAEEVNLASGSFSAKIGAATYWIEQA